MKAKYSILFSVGAGLIVLSVMMKFGFISGMALAGVSILIWLSFMAAHEADEEKRSRRGY